ncbi:MAG: acetate--CoA ligase [Deltaproteobacteria bacterium]|nr:acetate--CoA ligase [Deltaproteobacteria bacterium]
MSQWSIESLLKESRVFPPEEEFASRAHVRSFEQYQELYNKSIQDPDGFWMDMAQSFHWFSQPKEALAWDPPDARWFIGGSTNISYNAVDRHAQSLRRNKAAIIWEGEPGETRTLTYQQLHREVCVFANVLRKLGVRTGDRVAIYMGMVPEIAIAMLACARIGAVHTVVFGGFAAEALRDRINDATASLVVTCDGGYRRGQVLPLKETVDRAISGCPSVRHTVVFRRTGQSVPMEPGRDHYWHEVAEAVSASSAPLPVDAEHPLFILYTSGTTGKPKGVVHTTGGYMVGTAVTHKYVFDLHESDTYFCTADVGWITGHSYVVYGPLLNGATVLMYEGAVDYPDRGRLWSLCERYGVTIFYTAPTAIRSFIRWGEQWPMKHDLSSLRLLGTVGEPINPEAWMWYQRVIGNGRCPIVDTWWQTETGAIMISPLPGAIPTKPGSATLPFFGVVADVVRKDGSQCADNEGGYLVIQRPWPSMMRTIYGDHERYAKQYWAEIQGDSGIYFTGDGARRDENGYFWVMGRVDDVVNVSGHRLGTAEIESALVAHRAVAEAAVVGRPDEIKGQALVAFVTLRPNQSASASLKTELAEQVAREIGRFARPDVVRFTEGLPKTRSGKIMRRLLKEIAANGEITGDTTTLEDFGVVAQLTLEPEE